MSKKVSLAGILMVVSGVLLLGFYVIESHHDRFVSSFENASADQVSASSTQSAYTDKLATVVHYGESAFLVVGGKQVALSFNDGETLHDVLMRSSKTGLFDIRGRDFDGLGYFVDSIADLVPKKGESLILYVNGKKATLGVSSIRPKNGDIFEFKIEDNY